MQCLVLWRYWVLPSGIGCGIEQGCCVVKRCPVGWRAMVNCSGLWQVQLRGWVLLAACSSEWCSAWSTRHCGRELGHCFILFYVLKLVVPFLMCTPPPVVGCKWISSLETGFLYTELCCLLGLAIGYLVKSVGVTLKFDRVVALTFGRKIVSKMQIVQN